jgi:16S rRNA (adenine1518-N6/adenine1519-N6)-dimethyltransferase
MSSHKQTVSFLRRKFQEIGLEPYAKHGQNFLIDLNLLDLLVRVADVQPTDVVLEVGTGTGSLTVRLAERAGSVVTVEIDPHLAGLAEEQFDPDAPIILLQQDALRNKNHLHDNVLNTVREQLAKTPGGRFKLVANLPYSVATPIISNLLCSDLPPSSMTVTIQKELAERIVAAPRTKDYGSLSVWVQSQCYAMIVRELAPTVFWPRPKVSSAIVQIVLDPDRRLALGDLKWFHDFARGLFLHRRKFLRSALLGAFKSLDKPMVDAAMQAMNLGAQTRAEELTVDQIRQLSAEIRQQLDRRESND